MMKLLGRLCIVAASAALLGMGTGNALSLQGYASIIWVPVVVNSSTFTSEIYVHNETGVTVNYAVTYYGGTGTANAGAHACSPALTIPANTTAQYSLPTICPNLTFGAASNFGALRIYELDANNRPFSVYVRVQSFSGDGFSIEGFPAGELDNTFSQGVVNGVKRIGAAPGYQTNCFIGSLVEDLGTITYGVRSNTGATIGTDQVVAVGAGQFVRILDVFSAVGAPAGDYTNARVVFGLPSTNGSSIQFCTVQNNTSFDADFRIAKANLPTDWSRRQSVTVDYVSGSTTDLAGTLIPAPNSTGNEHVWSFYVRHPDWIKCTTTSQTPATSIEIELISPTGTVVAGGNNIDSFNETYLGEKSTQNSGTNGRWLLVVGDNGSTAGPTAYHITCTAGNGMSLFTYSGARPDSF